jgi:NADH-quinone oxidoreductase subunit C/D
VTGASLRATGLDYDLRKARPYSGYENFDFEVPLAHNGDAYDRAMVRLEEMRQSVRIIRQCLEQHAGRPVQGRPPADLPAAQGAHAPAHRDADQPLSCRVSWGPVMPAGESCQLIEATKGINSYYLTS